MASRGDGGRGGRGISSTAHEIIRGFRLLRLPLADGSPISRNFLVKRHQARDPTEKDSADRTLFVTQLDNFTTEAQLQRCFTAFGIVEKVEIKSVEKRTPKREQRLDHVVQHANYARVIFKEKASMEKALEAATGRVHGLAVMALPPSLYKEELRKSKSLYRDPVELRREVDTWMANYDLQEAERLKQERENAVDEDGFIKVGPGLTKVPEGGLTIVSVRQPSAGAGAFSEPLRGLRAPEQGDRRKKKKTSREMPDFYRFQLREKKRQEIDLHRKQKVEDMDKVDRMRKAKRFKM